MDMRPAWTRVCFRPASPTAIWMRGRTRSTSCGKDRLEGCRAGVPVDCRAGVPDLLAFLLVLFFLLIVELLADHVAGLVNLDLPVLAVDHHIRLVNSLAAGGFLVDLADGRAPGLALEGIAGGRRDLVHGDGHLIALFLFLVGMRA